MEHPHAQIWLMTLVPSRVFHTLLGHVYSADPNWPGIGVVEVTVIDPQNSRSAKGRQMFRSLFCAR